MLTAIQTDTILALAKEHHSFYLYDEARILQDVDRLKSHFGKVRFFYSVKANSAPRVVRCVLGQGLGLDAASLAEVEMGRSCGLSAEDIHYSAPGKAPEDIRGALGKATLIADSVNEVERIHAAARERGMTVEIGLRINPDFTFDSNTGAPSKFGIDEDAAYTALPHWKRLPHIRVTGLHLHLRSQELREEVIRRYHQRALRFAREFEAALGAPLRFVNLGSGLGIPYAPEDHDPDTLLLGRSIGALAEGSFPHARVCLETGRYAVGRSGVYVTTVMDKKTSHGKTFVLLHNTMNGFIRPSLAQLAGRYAPAGPLLSVEPLVTGRDAFQFIPLTEETARETVTLAGNLCTAADVVAEDVELPVLRPGNVVVMTNAGSYAAVLSPMQFSTQPPPAQFFLTREGRVTDAMV